MRVVFLVLNHKSKLSNKDMDDNDQDIPNADQSRLGWQEIIRRLWRCNHATVKGRMQIEAFEDLLHSIEECVAKKRNRPLSTPQIRRILARNVVRIRRLDRLLFKIAGNSADHGAEFFSELGWKLIMFESHNKQRPNSF
jgi:hypothetical protein